MTNFTANASTSNTTTNAVDDENTWRHDFMCASITALLDKMECGKIRKRKLSSVVNSAWEALVESETAAMKSKAAESVSRSSSHDEGELSVVMFSQMCGQTF